MTLMHTPGSRLGQFCVLILIFTVLLQAFGMGVFYMYLSKELKQMQDKYFKNGLGCFLEEDDRSWDSRDEESMINPCWELKSQLHLFVKKMTLRTFEEMIPTNPEKQYNPYLDREKGPKRVAAHITGSNRKRSTLPVLGPGNHHTTFFMNLTVLGSSCWPRWPRGVTPHLTSGEVAERSNPTSKERRLHRHRRAKRSYSMFKVRRGGCEEISLVQGKEQRLHFAGAAVKRYPRSR
ncbi:tumor necrosis factor ligand superfamily member 10 isoform X3 [Ovis aries]|uniref:tumor necrosis factor ligand superfamily member 10 isoform X3 n=1 Tax=Ovis aries TaxID=9940 RepID=UPI0029528F25|nr:tumor necrosis factor ligand superfamily member 10 isoform X3 [Ovis aries]